MFETRKSSVKKLLKEIERSFKGDAMIKQKRQILMSVEELAIAAQDQSLYEFWNEQSQIVNAQEARLQGRPYNVDKTKVFVP